MVTQKPYALSKNKQKNRHINDLKWRLYFKVLQLRAAA